jgi:predicted nuclease with TOPRIM domain
MDADATSSMLSEVAAQYDDIERKIEVQYQKFMAETKSDSDELDDRIKELAEQIEKLEEEAEKLEEVKAKMDRLMPKYMELVGSANSLYTKTTALEARAQKLKTSMELKRSMYIRTPVPKTRTPKPKG